MKRISLAVVVMLFTLLTALFAGDQKSPLATLTEVIGKVEILRGQSWEPLYPLQPLYQGDTLRVGKGDQATLMYLGSSSEMITELQSPYVVTEKRAKGGQKNNINKKIGLIVQRLIRKEEERSSVLTTRSFPYKTESLRVLQPDDTAILFPLEPVSLRWLGGQPPYHLQVSSLDKNWKEIKVLENDAKEARFDIPPDILAENIDYRWRVISGEQRCSGTFHVMSKAATQSIRSELSGILGQIPGKNSVTHYLIKYGYLLNRALVYDSDKVLTEAKEGFPQNDTFRKLAIY